MLDKRNLDTGTRLLKRALASRTTERTYVVSDEIFVVDDDPIICDFLTQVFSSEDYRVTRFGDGEEFEAAVRSRAPPACVILDVLLPGQSGLDILKDAGAHNYAAPFIVMSGTGAIPAAVEAIKIGAFDFVEKPFSRGTILERVRGVVGAWARLRSTGNNLTVPSNKFCGGQLLTQREEEVLAEILAAASNKEAAQHLGISPRTIEVHRAHIMLKLGAKNAVDLVRIAMSDRRQSVPENISIGAAMQPRQDERTAM